MLKRKTFWFFFIFLWMGKASIFGLIEPNRYQVEYIKIELNLSIEKIIALWRAENFEEIYQTYADAASKKAFTQEEFTQRMGKKNWIPQSHKLIDKDLRFVGMSNVFVGTEIYFSDRVKQYSSFQKKIIFKMTYEENEKNVWRMDLFRLLRAVY